MMWLEDACVVLEDRVLPRACVGVEAGRIQEVRERPHGDGPRVGARGLYLLPGLVDMHSDAIEKEAMPRPGVRFPMSLALLELDKKLAGHGITTVFHSVSLSGGMQVRPDDVVVELLKALQRQEHSLVRNRVHLRYEISNLGALELVRELLTDGPVHLFSFMDHTPGQGQYTNPEHYRHYARKTFGADPAHIEHIIAERLRLRQQVDEGALRQLGQLARLRSIPVASHDDDTPAKVRAQLELGVRISEFPVNLESAREARRLGLHVVVGAPNVMLGGSHSGHLGAEDALREGCADMLCSDYHPPSLLSAVFGLAERGTLPLPAAVALASANVARALGLQQELGSIAPGKRADLLLVRWEPGRPPVVLGTFVEGRQVYQVNYGPLSEATPPE